MNMRNIIIATAAMLCSLTATAQDRADRQQLSDHNSFSMILLGDPQGYVKYDINQPIFELTTAWCADNIDNLNIKAVLCTGDLVEQNENIVRNRAMLNQTSKQMWEWASHCMKRLDNKVPYIIPPETMSTDMSGATRDSPISPSTSPSSATASGQTAW